MSHWTTTKTATPVERLIDVAYYVLAVVALYAFVREHWVLGGVLLVVVVGLVFLGGRLRGRRLEAEQAPTTTTTTEPRPTEGTD